MPKVDLTYIIKHSQVPMDEREYYKDFSSMYGFTPQKLLGEMEYFFMDIIGGFPPCISTEIYRMELAVRDDRNNMNSPYMKYFPPLRILLQYRERSMELTFPIFPYKNYGERYICIGIGLLKKSYISPIWSYHMSEYKKISLSLLSPMEYMYLAYKFLFSKICNAYANGYHAPMYKRIREFFSPPYISSFSYLRDLFDYHSWERNSILPYIIPM